MDKQTKHAIKKIDQKQLVLATENNYWFIFAEAKTYTQDAPEELYCFHEGRLMTVPVKGLTLVAAYETKELANREDPTFGYFYLYNGQVLALEHNDYDGFCIAVYSRMNPAEVANHVKTFCVHRVNNTVVRKYKISTLL